MFKSALLATVAIAAYEGTDYTQNGDNWGQTEDFKLCDAGREQSPIDLSATGASSSRDMEINGYGYKDTAVLQTKIDRSSTKV